MKLNFSSGILAGIILASVLVLAASYSQASSISGAALPYGTTLQTVKTTATTTTTTSSSTAQPAVPTSTQSGLSNLSATLGAGNATRSQTTTTSAVIFAPANSIGQSPSSLATVIGHPEQLPLLLLPVLGALLLGYIFYRNSVPRD